MFLNVLIRVHPRHTIACANCRSWVVSGPLEKTYLESVPSSEFGTTTDVRQAAGYDIWLAAVLPEPAKTGSSTHIKNGDPEAAVVKKAREAVPSPPVL